MLLMFGVGLHFSLDDLLAVRKVALPGALVQMAVATLLGAGLAQLVGLESGRRAGVRAGAVGGQHGGAAARAREPAASSRPSPAASRSAGWSSKTWRWCWCWCCCRRSPGAAGRCRRRPTPARRVWQTLGLTLLQGRRLRAADAGGRPAGVPVAAVAGGAHRLARAVHALRGGGRRSASPSARRRCSASRSRSAPSSPAW